MNLVHFLKERAILKPIEEEDSDDDGREIENRVSDPVDVEKSFTPTPLTYLLAKHHLACRSDLVASLLRTGSRLLSEYCQKAPTPIPWRMNRHCTILPWTRAGIREKC